MRYLEKSFSDLAESIGLDEAPAIQRREMEKAFFAGAAAVFEVMMKNLSAEDGVTPEDEAMCDSIMLEIRAFFTVVGKESSEATEH